MRMDVRIYRVTVKSQAGNIWVYAMKTQKGQSHKTLRLGFQKFTHFAGKFRRGPQVQEKALLGLRIYL